MALLRRAVAWCLWFSVLFWWWMLLAGEWDHEEWIAAGAAAAIGTAVGETCRRAAELELRIPLEPVAKLPAALLMVVADFIILTGVLLTSFARLRPVRGRFVRRRAAFDPGGLDADSVMRRALTILIAGYSPNGYVVDVERRADRVVLHDLRPVRKSEEPA
jgi:hypothetical protein